MSTDADRLHEALNALRTLLTSVIETSYTMPAGQLADLLLKDLDAILKEAPPMTTPDPVKRAYDRIANAAYSTRLRYMTGLKPDPALLGESSGLDYALRTLESEYPQLKDKK